MSSNTTLIFLKSFDIATFAHSVRGPLFHDTHYMNTLTGPVRVVEVHADQPVPTHSSHACDYNPKEMPFLNLGYRSELPRRSMPMVDPNEMGGDGSQANSFELSIRSTLYSLNTLHYSFLPYK
jgi:hypothetical protein